MPDYVLVVLMGAAFVMPSLVACVVRLHDRKVYGKDMGKWWYTMAYWTAWLLAFCAFCAVGVHASGTSIQGTSSISYWKDFNELVAAYWVLGVMVSAVTFYATVVGMHDIRHSKQAA